MFGWFRKKERELSPVCIHDWVLVDMEPTYVDLRVEVVAEDYYIYVCPKCNNRKRLNEYEARQFERIFTNENKEG